jgi:tetratricopeptide (TPR) repeat protein
VRSTFQSCVVFASLVAFSAAGCNGTKGGTYAFAAKEKTDWFGMSALSAMLKPEPKLMQTSDPASKTDPTSLAHKNKPVGPDLYVHAARVYEKKGQLSAAEDQYLRALELNSNDAAALIGYAHCLDRQGKFDAAIAQYRKVVDLYPQDAAAHNDLGLCYARRGMINEALAELSRAVELDPQKPLYRNNIATVFVEIGRAPDALQHLLMSDPPAVAHYNLACLLHQRGQSQAAAQYFAQAATLDPTLVAAREWAAKLGAMPAQSQPAGSRLTDVRAVDPNSGFQRAGSFQPAGHVQPTAGFQPANNLQITPQSQPSAYPQPQPRQARTPDVGMPAHDMRWPQASVSDEQGSGFGAEGTGFPPRRAGSVQGSESHRGVVHASYSDARLPPSPETAESYAERDTDADEEAEEVPTGPRY